MESYASGEGPLRAPTGREGAWSAYLLAAAVALAFGAWCLLLTANLDPTARDQVHDLSLAIRIGEGTSLSDGNRHPLYPATLAPWASRDPSFFGDARLVSVVLAAISLLAVHVAVSRAFSPALGLLTMLGVLLEFRLQARRLCPEPLFAALLVLAASTLSRAAASRRPVFATASAGALTGAAWLAKGSATLSLAAAALHVLFSGGRRGPLRVGALLLGFVVLASPLLAWNVSQGRSPWFNVNSAHVMWEERWDVDLDRRSTATPRTWLAAHDPGDALARLADGLTRQRGVEWVYGFLAVLLASSLLTRAAARRGAGAHEALHAADPARVAWRRLALWTAVCWLPAMAWYAPIVSSRRLLFPIFPVLLAPALDAIGNALRTLAPGTSRTVRAATVRLARGAPIAALLLAAVTAVLLVASPGRPTVDPAFVEAGRRLAALPPGTPVLVRPS
ncbi:MAG TPA: hypothetical protein VND21_10820, partial [Planctomycetota bacterium]|nr:hypothetical protein [Planctomycetota bacterium]